MYKKKPMTPEQKEKHRIREAARRAADPDYGKSYREKNKKLLAEKTSKWKKENKEKAKEHNKKWRAKNREKTNEYNRKSKEKNKVSYSKKEALRIKKKRESDPVYRMKSNIRNMIGDSFRRQSKNYKKNSRTEIILGCSIAEFINYLLNLYPEKNIKIEDFGQFGYHLDHIIPISSAKTEEDVIKLCHYTNFQPLFWIDNIKKSDKIL